MQNILRIYLTPVHSDELIKEIKSLNPKKSNGPDNISAKIIDLLKIYQKNVNRAIEKCEYPVQMKMAKVIALYKKVKRYEANNYRPISPLSIFDKLLEKLLFRRVMKFLNANNILFKFQYSFRKLHSTTLALIEFTVPSRNPTTLSSTVVICSWSPAWWAFASLTTTDNMYCLII